MPTQTSQSVPRTSSKSSDLLISRRAAVRRGLAYLGRIARHPRRVLRFGSALLYCAAFMASTAADPCVRRRARSIALRGWAAWNLGWRGALEPSSADELSELVHGHCAAQRLGLRFPKRRAWLKRHARRFTTEEFLGWDPRAEPPPRNLREACACGWPNKPRAPRCGNQECRAPLPRQGQRRAWCLALTAAYCGERIGVPLGARYRQVLQWLPRLPDYASPRRGESAFHDAAYAVTHVVYTLNDYGRFQLSPEWLPREYRFLANHLEHALSLDDPDMVGEFLDTLRAFEVPEDHPAIEFGMRYLLSRQNPDGSWGPIENGHDYQRFHTTWAALDGLREFAWEGRGLSFPEALPDLLKWARA